MLTNNSRIRDVYAHPIGWDIIRQILLLTGRSDDILNNPLIGALRLKRLPALSAGTVDADFIDALLKVLNAETDAPRADGGSPPKAWWKQAVFYQIYPAASRTQTATGSATCAASRRSWIT
jgi:oligo-1,6-glucosidase